jgi:DNA-binding NarL/FixJ family response regulator
MTHLRVLIVAEPRLYRDGLVLLLRDGCRMQVIATTADALVACEQAEALEPDVVLVDMNLDRPQAAIQSLVRAAPASKIVALGTATGDDTVVGCFEAGAAGYLPANGSSSDLHECIYAAARGEMSCSPRIAAQLARRVADLAAELRTEQPSPELTVRETQILELIDQGLSNKQIASRLCIEVPTVKHHVHNILEKLQVSRRGEAAARARRGALSASPAPR